jgi:elongation factor Ts
MQISAQLVKELRQRSGAGMMECKKALVESDGNVDTAMEQLRKQGLAKAGKKAGRVAAEGRIVGAQDKGKAVLVEINCETDFVAKDKSFLAFADNVASIALESGSTDVEALKAAPYPEHDNVEEATKALVATIGEKIDVRRMARVQTDGLIGNYIHGGRIGVLVAIEGGNAELAKGIAMHVAAMSPQYITDEDVPAAFIAKEKEIAKGQMSETDRAKPADILDKIVSGKVRKVVSELTLTGQPYVLDTASSVGQVLEKEKARVVKVVRMAVGEGVEKKDENFADEVMKQAGLA